MSASRNGRAAPRKLVAIVVLAAIAYLASVLVPVVVSSFRFSQAVGSEALNGPVNEPATVVKRRLLARAETLGLALSPEQLVVQKDGPRFVLDADYVVPIRLFGVVAFDWRFRLHKEGTRRPPVFTRD